MRLFNVLLVSIATFAVACGGDPSASPDEPLASEGDAIQSGTLASKFEEAVVVDILDAKGDLVAGCSGALVAPKVVLTAGHCVHGFSKWHVKAPFAKKQSADAKSALTYDWKVKGDTVDPKFHDVGLIFLETPIDLATYPALATKEVANGTKVVEVGRVKSGKVSDADLYESAPKAVKDAKSIGYPFDYTSTDVIQPGDSGGPDFVVTKAAHTIVSVNSGGSDPSSKQDTEVLARVDLVASWIEKEIASHGGKDTSTSGSSSSSAAASSSSGGAMDTCAHSECTEGAKLEKTCSSCVEQVCASDAYCCSTAWDVICIDISAKDCGNCI